MSLPVFTKEIGLAIANASCESPAAPSTALEHLERAVVALRAMKGAAEAERPRMRLATERRSA